MDAVSFVLLNGVPFDEMSLDHDLGDHEPTGLDFLRWLVINQAQLLPRVIRIHSANPVGTMNMRQTLERAGVYTKHTLHGTGWEREDL